ncbi:hypothetical protein [Enterococcus ratti]
MKKALFKTLLISISILTIGFAVIPSVTVFANEQSTVNSSVSSMPSIEDYTTTYNSATNTTTVTMTDQQLVDFMLDQGLEVPQELLNAACSRADGVTKIVWHGKARNKNVDLYLSKATIVGLRASYTGAQLFNVIIQLYLGSYWGAAKAGAGAIANTIKMGSIKHGRTYFLRSWKYRGYVNQ